MQPGVWGVACAHCREVSRLALVNDSLSPTYWCLRCSSALNSCGRSMSVIQYDGLGALEDLAQEFQANLASYPASGEPSAITVDPRP